MGDRCSELLLRRTASVVRLDAALVGGAGGQPSMVRLSGFRR
jgi:hypothetical protein